MCNLMLPLRILCQHHGKTEASKQIRAGIVKTVRQWISRQQELSAEEKQQITDMFPQLEEAEPELVKDLKKLL